jgi:hypothetical protein
MIRIHGPGTACCRGQTTGMGNPFSDGMHFVEVRHDTSREIWITAGPRKEVVANVLKHFSRGHIAELCKKRVTYEEAALLNLKNGEARVYEDPNARRGGRLR